MVDIGQSERPAHLRCSAAATFYGVRVRAACLSALKNAFLG